MRDIYGTKTALPRAKRDECEACGKIGTRLCSRCDSHLCAECFVRISNREFPGHVDHACLLRDGKAWMLICAECDTPCPCECGHALCEREGKASDVGYAC